MTTIIRKMKFGFAVIGQPISSQGSAASKRLYRKKVTESASNNLVSCIKDNESIKIEIDWFSEDFHNKPDVDNIIKPIQDALKGVLFSDDNQVCSIIARKHDTFGIIRFHNETLDIISPLLNGNNDYVYIRIY